MQHSRAVAGRLALAGLAALSIGLVAVVASLVNSSGTPAFAASSPYELYCPGSPVGNLVLNNVVTSGTITPASPAAGGQFDLTGYQSIVVLPSAIVSAVAALGNSSISGSAVTRVDATGATPASISSGTLTISVPIPSPVPTTGLVLNLPATPTTVGPFTASGGAISITVDPAVSLDLEVSGSALTLACTPYPNNTAANGIVTSAPMGPLASPVIATATSGPGTGSTPTTALGATSTTTPAAVTPQNLTGAYELYCPGSPVGNLALNDAVTSATLSPASPTVGQSFSITGYQTVVNLPASLASAASSVSPGQPLAGSGTAQIDASGATPAATPQQVAFSVPIPTPIPTAGVSLSLPSTPATISGYTATGGGVTIQEDSSATLSLNVAGSPLTFTCTAYPNDTVTPSGITTGTPTAAPIAPVIALGGGGGSTTTTAGGGTTTTTTAAGIETSLTLGPGQGTVGQPVTVSAILSDTATSAPIPGESVSFTLNGNETCAATTDSTGTASCSLLPAEVAGTYSLAALFAGDASLQAANATASFTLNGGQATSLSYIAPPSVAIGAPFTMTAVLSTTAPATPLIGKTVSFTAGSGVGAQSCVGTTDATGTASCTVAVLDQSPGSIPVTVSFAGDASDLAASATASSTVPGSLQSSAGSLPVTPGSTVTVTGSGFTPGETVDFSLFTVHIDLGTATADAMGNVSKTVTIPAGIETGTHTILATGDSSGHMDSIAVTVSLSALTTTTTSTPPTTTIATAPKVTSTSRANTVPKTSPATSVPPAAVRAASARSLASTGIGLAVGWMALLGAVLVVLAAMILMALYAPKRLLARLSAIHQSHLNRQVLCSVRNAWRRAGPDHRRVVARR